MIRAALCGGEELAEAAAVLGLREADGPEVVLLDARSPDAVARAAALPIDIPRVVVAEGPSAALLRSAGLAHVVSGTAPELIGPALARALPRRERSTTRLIVVTAARGGVGRTLLATQLARRLAARLPTWLVDATGTGAAAWWLRVEVGGWGDLEPMVSELTVDHLRVVAAQPSADLRVVGGAGAAPSFALLTRCIERLRQTEELVIVDAPLLSDERSRPGISAADPRARTLVVSYGDPASLAALEPYDLAGAWLIASQCGSLDGHSPFRVMPRDEGAVAAASTARAPIGGRLGRAYDDLAELLALDAT